MATFKVGETVHFRSSRGETRGTVVALSVTGDSVQVQWPSCRVWHSLHMLDRAPEAAPACVMLTDGTRIRVPDDEDEPAAPVVDPPYPPNAMRTEDTMARYQCSRPVCTPGRDGMATSEHTAGPDIIPAAVLARRATGYHRGRVSVPTDLTDGLIPDAEPEGIVPRGTR